MWFESDLILAAAHLYISCLTSAVPIDCWLGPLKRRYERMNSHSFPSARPSAWFPSASRHFLFRVCIEDDSFISQAFCFIFGKLHPVLWQVASLQTRLNNHQCQNRLQQRWKAAGSSTVICATLCFHSFIHTHTKKEFNILSKLYRTFL